MKKIVAASILSICMLIIAIPLVTDESSAMTLTCPNIKEISSENNTVRIVWGQTRNPIGTTVEIWDITNNRKYQVLESSYWFSIRKNVTTGKKIQVRIRAYNVDLDQNGAIANEYYSPYSDIKSVVVSAGSTKRALDPAGVTFEDRIYTGKQLWFHPIVRDLDKHLILGRDTSYTLRNICNKNVGTYTAMVIGIGNYGGVVNKDYTILPAQISSMDIRLTKNSYVYSGKKHTPAVEVYHGETRLKKDESFLVSYKNNKTSGVASVIIEGIGNYTGTTEKNFIIKARSISNCVGSLEKKKYTYTGKRIKPKLTIKDNGKQLRQGRDYSVAYKKNKKTGVAYAIAKGQGNYKGTIIKKYRIIKKTVSKVKILLKSRKYHYTGKRIKPAVRIKDNGRVLRKGRDYSLKYINNKKPGTAKIIIKGKGNYKGTVKRTFIITDSRVLKVRQYKKMIQGAVSKKGMESIIAGFLEFQGKNLSTKTLNNIPSMKRSRPGWIWHRLLYGVKLSKRDIDQGIYEIKAKINKVNKRISLFSSFRYKKNRVYQKGKYDKIYTDSEYVHWRGAATDFAISASIQSATYTSKKIVLKYNILGYGIYYGDQGIAVLKKQSNGKYKLKKISML